MKEKKTNLFLIRHGQTLWNFEKRWQGNKNSDLTAHGIKQAYETKKLLDNQDIDFAYVSPLQRAKDTITIILEGRNIVANSLEQLKEINLGPWEGKLQEETSLSNPKEFNAFWNSPETFCLKGSESFVELQKRMILGLEYIFSKHEGSNILVVSHWISIKVALAYYLDQPISSLPNIENPKNAELLCLSKVGSKVILN